MQKMERIHEHISASAPFLVLNRNDDPSPSPFVVACIAPTKAIEAELNCPLPILYSRDILYASSRPRCEIDRDINVSG